MKIKEQSKGSKYICKFIFSPTHISQSTAQNFRTGGLHLACSVLVTLRPYLLGADLSAVG
jgi:hypothetical protein